MSKTKLGKLLGLSRRASRVVAWECKVETIEELEQLEDWELRDKRGCGNGTLREIKEKLASYRQANKRLRNKSITIRTPKKMLQSFHEQSALSATEVGETIYLSGTTPTGQFFNMWISRPQARQLSRWLVKQ